MLFRYLVWHMDGALFDTRPAMGRALRNALSDLGVSAPVDEIAVLLAQSARSCATAAAFYGLDQITLQRRYAHHYSKILLREQPPLPDAVTLCQRTAEVGGHNYVYTDRDHIALERFLAAYGMLELFSGWLTAGDSAGSPDPVTLVAACDLPPQEVLVISNRERDIWHAHEAGLATCLFGAVCSLTADFTITGYDILLGNLFPMVQPT
jgi:beta-phosphoglucomutase-like phosphatase (HAD superfamily)